MDLDCRPDLVRAAREFVRSVLVEWELESLADDAVLATSELVANAVLHARTAIRVRVSSPDGLSRVRVEVFDENTRMPAAASCPDDATSGRGLNLIAALGTAWGTAHQGEGKIVWVELGQSAEGPDDEACLDLLDSADVDEALNEIRSAGTATSARRDGDDDRQVGAP